MSGDRHYGIAAPPDTRTTEDERLRRGSRYPVNAERDAEIRRRHAKGDSLASIGAMFGLSKQRVHQICRHESESSPWEGNP